MANLTRERDIRRGIKELLEATGQFNGVFLNALPEDRGRSAGLRRAVAIEPNRSRVQDRWDSASDGDPLVECDMTITVLSRDEDEDIRDDVAELLLNVVQNTLNKASIADLTFVQMSQVVDWNWLPAAPPERRIRASYRCVYECPDGWSGFHADE